MDGVDLEFRLEPCRILRGIERKAAEANAIKMYQAGWNIREIAAQFNRSYGFVRELLMDSGEVVLRKRGGKRLRRR